MAGLAHESSWPGMLMSAMMFALGRTAPETGLLQDSRLVLKCYWHQGFQSGQQKQLQVLLRCLCKPHQACGDTYHAHVVRSLMPLRGRGRQAGAGEGGRGLGQGCGIHLGHQRIEGSGEKARPSGLQGSMTQQKGWHGQHACQC